MNEHAVVVVGRGPSGLMLAGELVLAGIDVGFVERRLRQDRVGRRAGGLHPRTIGFSTNEGSPIAFFPKGRLRRSQASRLSVSTAATFPHPLQLRTCAWAEQHRAHLADLVQELPVKFYCGREATAFTQDDTGVTVELSDRI